MNLCAPACMIAALTAHPAFEVIIVEDFPSWQQGIRKEYPALRGSKHAEVAIVGGGLTGVTCAYMLAQQGLSVAVVESRSLGKGSTWACTGKVTSQLTGVYETIARHAGIQAASAYARLMQQAVLGAKEVVQHEHLPCAWAEHSVGTFAETTDDLPALRRMTDLQRRLGLSVHISQDAAGCPFPVEQSSIVHRQGMLSPLPYLLGLAAAAEKLGCRLYEHSPVLHVDGRTLHTDQGTLEADYVLLATGTPLGCQSLARLAQVQQRACRVLVLESPVPLHNSHLSVQPDEMTLRPIPGGMLLAWDMERAGSTKKNGRELILRRTLQALLPEARPVDVIDSQDVWSGDGLPLIGPIHPGNDRLFMATGYNGWGLCNAWLAARIITGHVTGHPLPEAVYFRPDRHYSGHILPQLQEGMRIAGAYLGGLTRPSAPTCPHMGGKLRYNPHTSRWECPCHGSVFSTLGEPLHAPAAARAPIDPRHHRG